MSFTLPANLYCPTASAPSLPWRSRIPSFFCAAAIPSNAPFKPIACDYPERSPQPVAAPLPRIAIGETDSAGAPEISGMSAVTPAVGSAPSRTDVEVPSSTAVAVGVGAIASAGVAVSAGASVSAGEGATVDSSPPASMPVADFPDIETQQVDTQQTNTSTSPAESRSTPIPPHLLSPVLPNRPSVPASVMGGSDAAADAVDESSLSLEETFSPQSTSITDDDELIREIEGGYLDGAGELASVTSFGDVESPPQEQATEDTPEPNSEAVFLDALESAPVVSMGEVVDENVLGFSSDASTSAGIVGDGGDASPSADAMTAVGDVDGDGDIYGDGTPSYRDEFRTRQPKRSGGSVGRFVGGFIIGFAIVAGSIALGVRLFKTVGPSDPAPASESTTEIE
ncbi:MAG: hypothetical protein AAGE92_00945 [Cyanobacteria bacterium P01_G01_bin.4]